MSNSQQLQYPELQYNYQSNPNYIPLSNHNHNDSVSINMDIYAQDPLPPVPPPSYHEAAHQFTNDLHADCKKKEAEINKKYKEEFDNLNNSIRRKEGKAFILGILTSGFAAAFIYCIYLLYN